MQWKALVKETEQLRGRRMEPLGNIRDIPNGPSVIDLTRDTPVLIGDLAPASDGPLMHDLTRY